MLVSKITVGPVGCGDTCACKSGESGSESDEDGAAGCAPCGDALGGVVEAVEPAEKSDGNLLGSEEKVGHLHHLLA